MLKDKEKELVTGNPLLALGADVSFNMKRRWDEDVVFKNQARNEPKAQKRFVNDTIRNDFHKRFLQRYIR
ncbi:protein CWC15 [Haematococcus lacustris]|uniref:Protein CWC15 n=1 Tax=Haematococcus lacustris TaxID=44745 RepID=A0A6A0AKX8_HAELA|nr:protein CWC15 [Haematococcus lacustris]